ncbi:MAG TPA: hypothetical protein VGH90_03830 [Chthoniobacteraceae bacterium]|jgi:hypothetical protein
MKIEVIYIACYKYDLRFTRILVASIRQWYPEIPIVLIKDLFYGDFDTWEIEKIWNVSRLDTERHCFGWGFSKVEVLCQPERRRCLVLDSDIIFTGPLLETLEQCKSDFVVQHEDPAPEFVASHYFDLPALQRLDPQFVFPGFTFNTGQIVATTGVLSWTDFSAFVAPENPPRVLHPEIFKFGEQGLLNYVLMKKAQIGACSLERQKFMETPEDSKTSPAFDIRLEQLGPASPHRYLIHWCGLKKGRLSDMARGDLLLHFERQYYAAVPGGTWRKWARLAAERIERSTRSLLRKTFLHRLLKRAKV